MHRRDFLHAIRLTAFLLWTASTTALAQAGGEQVVVVYNLASSGSKAVAEHYAARRGVPASQVFGFELSTNGEISRADFTRTLQLPLARRLETAGLWRFGKPASGIFTNGMAGTERAVVDAKIRYAVLCYGVPYKIAPDATLAEEGTENLRPELRRNEAAVDSELALLPLIKPAHLLSGPLRNPLFGVTNAAGLHPTNGLLMVARLDGPSEAVARGLVDKAIEAETRGLWGRAYVDMRNIADPNYKQGDEALRAAADICRMLGYETLVDTNAPTFASSVPVSHIAFYAGWYDADVSGPFARAEVEFMPGAFAYHLHSASASELRHTNRNWVGPLLARGATTSMGTVYEPYLTGTPDIAVFTERLLFTGFSFGEAAYASQSILSWQTTVVGDPLYRPLARNLDQLREELEQQQSPLAAWPYLRLVNINLAQGKPLEVCAGFVEELPLRKTSPVLTEKLGDLYAALGKPSSAVHAWQQTLKLEPSRQQALRVRLQLADKLEQLERRPEALGQLQELLREQPDYAGRPAIEKRMAPLSQTAVVPETGTNQ